MKMEAKNGEHKTNGVQRMVLVNPGLLQELQDQAAAMRIAADNMSRAIARLGANSPLVAIDANGRIGFLRAPGADNPDGESEKDRLPGKKKAPTRKKKTTSRARKR